MTKRQYSAGTYYIKYASEREWEGFLNKTEAKNIFELTKKGLTDIVAIDRKSST